MIKEKKKCVRDTVGMRCNMENLRVRNPIL